MGTASKSWRKRLHAEGFIPRDSGGRRGVYGTRRIGPVVQAVGVLIDRNHRKGAFNIQLNINMALPASEPSHDVILLLADLSPHAVTVQEPWVHSPDSVTWWPAEALVGSLTAFEQYGLPWLHSNGKVAHLIEYFEEEYRRLDAHALEDSNPSLIRKATRWLAGSKKAQVTGHQQYLLWLAMLYQAQGEHGRALEHLDEYGTWVEARGMHAEMERLERHRALLMRASDPASGFQPG